MIESVIESYLTLFLSISIGSLVIFFIGLYFICKSYFTESSVLAPTAVNQTEEQSADPIIVNPVTLRICETMEPQIIKQETKSNVQDFAAISGDDILSTQLDLARAYIEAGRSSLAKNILQSVLVQGSDPQKDEAHHLLTLI